MLVFWWRATPPPSGMILGAAGTAQTKPIEDLRPDPKIMYSAMEEEKEALQHGIQKIWDSIKARNKKEFASIEISSSWKNARK